MPWRFRVVRETRARSRGAPHSIPVHEIPPPPDRPVDRSPSVVVRPLVVEWIPRSDVDTDAGGIDVDPRSYVDADARGINADTWDVHADTWGIHDRRSHIMMLVDGGAPRLSTPLARLGSLRPKKRQPDQKQERRRNPLDKPFHRSSSSGDPIELPWRCIYRTISTGCSVTLCPGKTLAERTTHRCSLFSHEMDCGQMSCEDGFLGVSDEARGYVTEN